MAEKNCVVCGTTHNNKSDFCDFECEMVYGSNKEFIDANKEWGVYFL